MKRLLALSVLVLALAPFSATSAHAACHPPNCWGAIAINTATGQAAYMYNYPTAAIARARALARCGFRCNRSLVFHNSCGAYALARNGGWGWGAYQPTLSSARRRAMFECVRNNPGAGCRVRIAVCTSRT